MLEKNKKIKVSINEISSMFDQLINQQVSREEVSNWALERLMAEDDSDLEYIPLQQEVKIWSAIKYLTGVDLVDLSGEYLHSLNDFRDFRTKLGI